MISWDSFLRMLLILLLKLLLNFSMLSFLSLISHIKYSQMMAELNLPPIKHQILCIVHVSYILSYEVFVYLLRQYPLLVSRNNTHGVNDSDCVLFVNNEIQWVRLISCRIFWLIDFNKIFLSLRNNLTCFFSFLPLPKNVRNNLTSSCSKYFLKL